MGAPVPLEPSGGGWQDAVSAATKRALQYSLTFNSKSAQESEEETRSL